MFIDAIDTANTVGKYCAYLVFFCPIFCFYIFIRGIFRIISSRDYNKVIAYPVRDYVDPRDYDREYHRYIHTVVFKYSVNGKDYNIERKIPTNKTMEDYKEGLLIRYSFNNPKRAILVKQTYYDIVLGLIAGFVTLYICLLLLNQ